jgi:hypothetical protein
MKLLLAALRHESSVSSSTTIFCFTDCTLSPADLLRSAACIMPFRFNDAFNMGV